jgi:hypothetical protein
MFQPLHLFDNKWPMSLEGRAKHNPFTAYVLENKLQFIGSSLESPAIPTTGTANHNVFQYGNTSNFCSPQSRQ